jgi:hypothetical protein
VIKPDKGLIIWLKRVRVVKEVKVVGVVKVVKKVKSVREVKVVVKTAISDYRNRHKYPSLSLQ